jgi:hypothetical protein
LVGETACVGAVRGADYSADKTGGTGRVTPRVITLKPWGAVVHQDDHGHIPQRLIRPMRTLVLWPDSGGNALVTCRSPADGAQDRLSLQATAAPDPSATFTGTKSPPRR